jgi:DNA-binding MarR family transcriptional regulator
MAAQAERGAAGAFLCRSLADNGDVSLQAFEQALLSLIWLEQKRLAQILAVHGLTVPQFLALTSIWHRQQGCHMGELASDMLQSSATMTGIVDRLVRMELVHRQAVAHDRRLVIIDLTERGRKLLITVGRQKQERLEEILSRLTTEERVTLVRLLRRYLEASSF